VQFIHWYDELHTGKQPNSQAASIGREVAEVYRRLNKIKILFNPEGEDLLKPGKEALFAALV
jgi:hypothetical protein